MGKGVGGAGAPETEPAQMGDEAAEPVASRRASLGSPPPSLPGTEAST